MGCTTRYGTDYLGIYRWTETLRKARDELDGKIQDRKAAMEQLVANLMQLEDSADKLRNPLAVIMSSLELRDEIGSDRVFEIIEESSIGSICCSIPYICSF